jgi:hypothetical protein
LIRRRLAGAGAAIGRSVAAALRIVGREIGILEVAILAVAAGAYLVARGYLSPPSSAGIALMVGGALALWVKLLELRQREKKT